MRYCEGMAHRARGRACHHQYVRPSPRVQPRGPKSVVRSARSGPRAPHPAPLPSTPDARRTRPPVEGAPDVTCRRPEPLVGPDAGRREEHGRDRKRHPTATTRRRPPGDDRPSAGTSPARIRAAPGGGPAAEARGMYGSPWWRASSPYGTAGVLGAPPRSSPRPNGTPPCPEPVRGSSTCRGQGGYARGGGPGALAAGERKNRRAGVAADPLDTRPGRLFRDRGRTGPAPGSERRSPEAGNP